MKPLKHFKNSTLVLRRNSNPIVFDPEAGEVPIAVGPNLNFRSNSGRNKFRRIGNQINQNLSESDRVGHNCREWFNEIDRCISRRKFTIQLPKSFQERFME